VTKLLIKRCPKCGHLGGLGFFYRARTKPGGITSWCKECTKSYAKEAQATIGGKLAHKKAIARQRMMFPEKIKARNAVCNAVRDGRLIRQPCEVCGKIKVEAHHLDYKKPFEIQWLCPYHHREQHKIQEENIK